MFIFLIDTRFKSYVIKKSDILRIVENSEGKAQLLFRGDKRNTPVTIQMTVADFFTDYLK